MASKYKIVNDCICIVSTYQEKIVVSNITVTSLHT